MHILLAEVHITAPIVRVVEELNLALEQTWPIRHRSCNKKNIREKVKS